MNTQAFGSFEISEDNFNRVLKSVQVICGAAPEHALMILLGSSEVEFEKKNEIMNWLFMIFDAFHQLPKETKTVDTVGRIGYLIAGMIVGWSLMLLGTGQMDAFDLFNSQLSEQ